MNLIAIVGMCGSGKSIASEYFEKMGYKKIYLGGITMDKLKEENLEVNPENEKMMREKLRKDYGMGAYALLSIPKIEELIKTDNVVLDGLYSWDELKILKEKYPNIKVISIVVDKNIRYERLTTREIRGAKYTIAVILKKRYIRNRKRSKRWSNRICRLLYFKQWRHGNI